MAEWIWEPDDFAALWLGDANDRMPALLRYHSRFALRDQFEAHRITLRESYSPDEYDRIQLAVHTVTNCDFRIEILGGTSRYEGSDGTQQSYRIIGARTHAYAAVLHQLTRGDTNGRIRMRLLSPENLPATLAGMVPSRDPGAAQPITVHPADLRDGRESLTGKAPHERYRRMLSGPIDGGATAALIAGPLAVDSKPWNQAQWYDLPDGRYLEVHTEHITVRPVSAGDLGTRFAGWIERAVQRIREDQPDSW